MIGMTMIESLTAMAGEQEGTAFLHYDSTGRIVQIGKCHASDLDLQVVPGLTRLDNAPATFADLTNSYIHNGVVTPRPTLEGFDKTSIAPDGLDTATMIVPPGCVANVNGEDYVVDDGVLEIGSTYFGLYVVKIDHWPFMPFKEVVTCA